MAAFTSEGVRLATNFYRDVIFTNPKWSPFDLDFNADVARARKLQADVRLEPDAPARSCKGRRANSSGTVTDGVVAARHSVEYFEAVSKSVGSEAARENMRLFMVPGAVIAVEVRAHSRSMPWRLSKWVEQGSAPERIIASRPLKGGGARTRPLYSHPKVAHCKGQGDTDHAANFECPESWASRRTAPSPRRVGARRRGGNRASP